MSIGDDILRKLLGQSDDLWGANYVDLEHGIFDCRVTLTAEEIAHLKALGNDGDSPDA